MPKPKLSLIQIRQAERVIREMQAGIKDMQAAMATDDIQGVQDLIDSWAAKDGKL